MDGDFRNYHKELNVDHHASNGIATDDLYVEVKLLFTDGTPIAVPQRTKFNDKHAWDEWLHFPFKYNELPYEAVVCYL